MKTAISCSNSQVSTETQVTASPTPLSHLSDSAQLQRKKSNLPAEQQRKFLRQARQKVPPLPKHNCCNFISFPAKWGNMLLFLEPMADEH